MRILHSPVNIGNQPWALSRAERRLGVHSEVVCNHSMALGFNVDRVLQPAADKSVRAKYTRLFFGLRAPFRYDVLHYYFGHSLLAWDVFPGEHQGRGWINFLDLKLAKRMGRRTLFTLQGCDVRIAAKSNTANKTTMCRPSGCSLYCRCISHLDTARQHFIDKYLPMVDRVFYLNPELARFIPRGDFMPYSNVDIREIVPTLGEPNTTPRILHAPSDDSIKGSTQIEAALRELASRYAFEYVSVRGLPHAQAMELYRSCDLVIDQLLAGWYGGFAVEAMAMAKPVASYIREEDLAALPAAMREELPVLRINEETLLDDLTAILERRPEWPVIGERSRRFVERWHNPDRIARALMRVYRDPNAAFILDGI
jgi:hypothetical protein